MVASSTVWWRRGLTVHVFGTGRTVQELLKSTQFNFFHEQYGLLIAVFSQLPPAGIVLCLYGTGRASKVISRRALSAVVAMELQYL